MMGGIDAAAWIWAPPAKDANSRRSPPKALTKFRQTL